MRGQKAHYPTQGTVSAWVTYEIVGRATAGPALYRLRSDIPFTIITCYTLQGQCETGLEPRGVACILPCLGSICQRDNTPYSSFRRSKLSGTNCYAALISSGRGKGKSPHQPSSRITRVQHGSKDNTYIATSFVVLTIRLDPMETQRVQECGQTL